MAQKEAVSSAQEAPLSFQEACSAEILEKVLTLHSQDKLFQAHRMLEKIETSITLYKFQFADVAESLEVVCHAEEKLNTNETIKKIRSQIAETSQLLKLLQDDEGWIPLSTGKYKSYYKKEQYSDLHSFKLSADLNASLLNLCVLIYEVDLYTTMFPYFKFVKEIAHPARCTKIVHWAIRTPWPISARESVVLGFAVDGLDEDDAILVHMKTIDKFDGVPLPTAPADVVRIDVHYGGFMFCPITEQKTRVTFCGNVDPKISFIPAWAMNWIGSKIATIFLRMLERFARRIKGSEHERRFQTDRKFYDWLEDLVQSYIRKRINRDENFAAVAPLSRKSSLASLTGSVEEEDHTLQPHIPATA